MPTSSPGVSPTPTPGLALHYLDGARTVLGIEIPDFASGSRLHSTLRKLPELQGLSAFVCRRSSSVAYLPFFATEVRP